MEGNGSSIWLRLQVEFVAEVPLSPRRQLVPHLHVHVEWPHTGQRVGQPTVREEMDLPNYRPTTECRAERRLGRKRAGRISATVAVPVEATDCSADRAMPKRRSRSGRFTFEVNFRASR